MCTYRKQNIWGELRPFQRWEYNHLYFLPTLSDFNLPNASWSCGLHPTTPLQLLVKVINGWSPHVTSNGQFSTLLLIDLPAATNLVIATSLEHCAHWVAL